MPQIPTIGKGYSAPTRPHLTTPYSMHIGILTFCGRMLWLRLQWFTCCRLQRLVTVADEHLFEFFSSCQMYTSAVNNNNKHVCVHNNLHFPFCCTSAGGWISLVLWMVIINETQTISWYRLLHVRRCAISRGWRVHSWLVQWLAESKSCTRVGTRHCSEMLNTSWRRWLLRLI